MKLIETHLQKIRIENSITKEKIILNENKKNENTNWSSQFKKVLKLTWKETKLFPLGKIAFTKPLDLRQLLKTFSKIAKHRKTFCSKKFNKCAICDYHGSHSDMVGVGTLLK